MSTTRCYQLLLLLALGDCVMLRNLFIPILRRTTPKPREIVQKPGRYWVEDLKESVFKTISPAPPFNKEVYHAIFTAPFYGGPDSTSMFGDILTLASGDLKKDLHGVMLFCQEDCIDCSPCNENSTIQQVQWTVKRIRHHEDGNTYRYDLQINVNPFIETRGGRQIRSRGLMGHVFSYNDPQPPSTEAPRTRDYLLKLEDYDVQEYNDVKDARYRKFTDLYKPGFIIKVDAERAKHVIHDVPFLTERPPIESIPNTRLYPREYPSIHHHHHGGPPYLQQTINHHTAKSYPDYYKEIYNEVLQTVLANSKLWQGSPMHSGNENSCSGKDTRYHQTPIKKTKVVSMNHRSDHQSAKQVPNFESFSTTATRVQNANLTTRNLSKVPAHQGLKNKSPDRFKGLETTTEIIVDKEKEKISPFENASNSQDAVWMHLLLKEDNVLKNRTGKPMQRDKKNFMIRQSKSREPWKMQGKLNDSTTTVTPQTTIFPMEPEDFLEDTELPAFDLTTENSKSSERVEVTDSPRNTIIEESTESDDEGVTDLAGSDSFEDEFAKVTNMDVKHMINSDAWKELKVYKQLLKQLAQSVISHGKNNDGIPTGENTTAAQNSTPVSTTTGRLKHPQNSYHHREQPQKGSLGTW